MSLIVKHEKFDKTMHYLIDCLRDSDKEKRDAALQNLPDMFYNMLYNDEFALTKDSYVESVLPILFENLKQVNDDYIEEILLDITYLMPKFASRIYKECFANGKAAFFKSTPKKLQKYERDDIYICKSVEEKKEFIISFAYYSSNYEGILELCLTIINNANNQDLYEDALKGIITLVRRFNKIDFNKIISSIDKFTMTDEINDDKEFQYMNEHCWVNSLLIDIAVLIPSLRERSREIYNKRTSSSWGGRFGPQI